MLEKYSDIEGIVLALALFFFAVVLPVTLWKKRRGVRAAYKDDLEIPIEGDLNDLREAERNTKAQLSDRERLLAENYVLQDRYMTLHGFDRSYMEAFAQRLRQDGLHCEIVFQETMPMGVAASAVEPQGFFELYVPREKFESADALIRQWLKQK